MISPDQREVALKMLKKKGMLPHPTTLHLQNLIFQKIKDEHSKDSKDSLTVTKSLDVSKKLNKTSLQSWYKQSGDDESLFD